MRTRLFTCSAAHRDLHSFPTRRSSDLGRPDGRSRSTPRRSDLDPGSAATATATRPSRRKSRAARSEEHTSELQSHSDLVCRLLLEKKKNTTESTIHHKHDHEEHEQ